MNTITTLPWQVRKVRHPKPTITLLLSSGAGSPSRAAWLQTLGALPWCHTTPQWSTFSTWLLDTVSSCLPLYKGPLAFSSAHLSSPLPLSWSPLWVLHWCSLRPSSSAHFKTVCSLIFHCSGTTLHATYSPWRPKPNLLFLPIFQQNLAHPHTARHNVHTIGHSSATLPKPIAFW